ncbi:hypothetical protein AURDEDRAFT_173147 [Auricularia subglabra TFB-10046 SS5]|nr:hypothetical protein AURDEDRAFT_173147 [Auricularia subglabra TFB-10046 SS5]
MSTDANPAHRVAYQAAAARGCHPDTLGMPVRYYDGPYAGKLILTIIEVTGKLRYIIIKPDLGRKYGLRDSRPLDPPAVVQVRLLEIKNHGTAYEQMVEIDVDSVHTPGLICYAELYPYNPDFELNPSLYMDSCPPPTPIQPNSGPIDRQHVLARGNVYPPANLPRQPRVRLPREAALPLQLHGERHQNVIIVPDIRGSATKVMYFIFSELHVRLTGHFMLKYTAMSVDTYAIYHDLCQRSQSNASSGSRSLERTKRAPLLAECWGGVFAIYPSKLHPPLKPSTELTNHLSRCGAKLHSRNKQRFGRGADPPDVRPGAVTKGEGASDGEDSPVSGFPRAPTPAPTGPVSVAFIRDAALAASYDRERDAWLERARAQPLARGEADTLPPLSVAIPEHAAWAAAHTSRAPNARARLHGEVSRKPDDGGGGESDDEMETERPRAPLAWSSSNVRGD